MTQQIAASLRLALCGESRRRLAIVPRLYAGAEAACAAVRLLGETAVGDGVAIPDGRLDPDLGPAFLCHPRG
jgi:hypothetical protein